MNKPCLKCNYPDHVEGAEFCENCGLELDSNYCTNDHCDINNTNDPISLPGYSCYCPYCGDETTYYKEGYIKPRNFDPHISQ